MQYRTVARGYWLAPAAGIAAIVALALAAPSQRAGATRLASGPTVHYRAGWNLVAATTGSTLDNASGPFYAFGPGASEYQQVNRGEIIGGRAVWAYLPADADIDVGRSVSEYSRVMAPADQWVLIGNPSTTAVLPLSGDDVALAYDTIQGYVAVTDLQPGQGAWVLNHTGGDVLAGRPPTGSAADELRRTQAALTATPNDRSDFDRLVSVTGELVGSRQYDQVQPAIDDSLGAFEDGLQKQGTQASPPLDGVQRDGAVAVREALVEASNAFAAGDLNAADQAIERARRAAQASEDDGVAIAHGQGSEHSLALAKRSSGVAQPTPGNMADYGALLRSAFLAIGLGMEPPDSFWSLATSLLNGTALPADTPTATSTASTTTVSCPPSTVAFSSTISCTATVAGTAGTPTGTITWTSGVGSFSAIACTLSSGACSTTYIAPSSGTSVSITASYGGDTTYAASSGTATLTLIKIASITTVTCSPSTVGLSGTSNCTATVAGTAGTPTAPTGTIAWTSGGVGSFSASTCTLSGGACGTTYTAPSSGTSVSITASYGGDTTYATSRGTATLTLVSSQASTTTVSCSPSTVALSGTSSCTATVAGTAGMPTGTINWTSVGVGSFSATACTLSGGACSTTYTAPSSGTSVSITANYGGDTTYAASSGTATLTLFSSRASTTTVSCSPSTVVLSGTSSCTATVAGTAVTPTGTITWTSGGVGSFSAITCTLSGGVCSTTYTAPSSGTSVSITASYGGDTTYATSSGSAAVTLTKIASTTTVSCPPRVAFSSTISCTATVAGTAGTPTGTINWTSGGVGSFSAISCTLSGGVCSTTYTAPSSGTSVTITASYGGNPTYATSSGTATLTLFSP